MHADQLICGYVICSVMFFALCGESYNLFLSKMMNRYTFRVGWEREQLRLLFVTVFLRVLFVFTIPGHTLTPFPVLFGF